MAFPDLSWTWHLQYSSRAFWLGKRNVQALFSGFTASDTLVYTYQEDDVLDVKPHRETKWEVVGRGKDGGLKEWMTEMEAGIIMDTAGEIRADWRSDWMIVSLHSPSGGSDEVDILCSRQRVICEETMNDILGTLSSKGDQFSTSKEVVLQAVPDDGARIAEMIKRQEEKRREWEQRTGKDVGISETLLYDDVEVEEKGVLRCGLQ